MQGDRNKTLLQIYALFWIIIHFDENIFFLCCASMLYVYVKSVKKLGLYFGFLGLCYFYVKCEQNFKMCIIFVWQFGVRAELHFSFIPI